MKYRPERANRDADALSRVPTEQLMDMCNEEVGRDWIKATLEAMNAQEKGNAFGYYPYHVSQVK